MSQVNLKKRQIAANWVDIAIEERQGASLLVKEGFPNTLIDSALTAGALPKVESESGTVLVLLRVFDGAADRRAAGTRELTRKLGVFLHANQIVTFHRFKDEEFPALFQPVPADNGALLTTLINRTIQSYTDALANSEDQFDALEAAVFQAVKTKPFRLRDAYYEKRRLTIIRKMLKLHLEVIDSLISLPEAQKLSKKKALHALSACEALLEGMNHLLQLQLSIVSHRSNEASQRTNEVMRILTAFSAFFLPLSFIAGVYGMNFEHMPELKHPLGYFGSLGLMAFIATGIFIWFRKRGWLGKGAH